MPSQTVSLDDITFNSQLAGLRDVIEASNGLAFASIDLRVKVARMLLDPEVKDCLDSDRAIPACGVAAYRMLGGE